MSKKAVILLSGGMDSTTCLAIAKDKGYECYAISFDYGQRNSSELEASRVIAKAYGVKAHKLLTLSLRDIGGSALTDDSIDIPEEESLGIPVTYVPARNALFLSLALGWAEVLGAYNIYIGANYVDYSGYPDCRPEFLDAFERMSNLATKAGIEGNYLHIHAPLLKLSKADIINEGCRLGVDYSITVSCYQANEKGLACGVCESCRYRKKGFEDAMLEDTTAYAN